MHLLCPFSFFLLIRLMAMGVQLSTWHLSTYKTLFLLLADSKWIRDDTLFRRDHASASIPCLSWLSQPGTALLFHKLPWLVQHGRLAVHYSHRLQLEQNILLLFSRRMEHDRFSPIWIERSSSCSSELSPWSGREVMFEFRVKRNSLVLSKRQEHLDLSPRRCLLNRSR